MKKMIPILILTHLLCILLGSRLAANRAEPEEIPETTAFAGITHETTVETKTTEQNFPTEDTSGDTGNTTDATEEQYVPACSPVETIPQATQPSAAESPASNLPETVPPAVNPGENETPAGGGL